VVHYHRSRPQQLRQLRLVWVGCVRHPASRVDDRPHWNQSPRWSIPTGSEGARWPTLARLGRWAPQTATSDKRRGALELNGPRGFGLPRVTSFTRSGRLCGAAGRSGDRTANRPAV